MGQSSVMVMLTKRKRSYPSRAFTLIEILIVVVILAILAAIVIPHFTKASETAKRSNVLTQLQTVRKQLKIYHVSHNARYPTLAQMWGNLTGKTDVNGNPGTDYGPYLTVSPENPFTDGSTLAADNTADWEYDETTGKIKAVVPAAKITQLGLSPSDTVAGP
ncbi:MAG: prepilin-type N-terminal cleavage/methylation domain-containing protein [Phycisphaeraceae bacterium]